MTSQQPGSPMDPLGTYLGEEDMHRVKKLLRMLCGNFLCSPDFPALSLP